LALLAGDWPFVDDATSWFSLQWEWMREAVRSGVLPLWNPYIFCGMPMLGNGQTALFYPPAAFLLLPLPMPVSLALLMLLHTMLAGAGALKLARCVGLSRTAAWLVAACLMLNGTVSGHLFSGHMTWHMARAYTPWILWALLGVMRAHQTQGEHEREPTRQSRARWVGVAAALLALQLLAGSPPVVLLCAALVGTAGAGVAALVAAEGGALTAWRLAGVRLDGSGSWVVCRSGGHCWRWDRCCHCVTGRAIPLMAAA
jgi:hypothetical protein